MSETGGNTERSFGSEKNLGVNKGRNNQCDSKHTDYELSSKHTRLRYLLVISSILFALICRFEVESFRIPLLFAELDGMPSQLEFVGGAFTFYIFILVSFVLRTKIEISRKGPLVTLAENSLNEVLATNKKFSKNFGEFLRNERAIENYLEADLPRLDILISQIEQKCDSIAREFSMFRARHEKLKPFFQEVEAWNRYQDEERATFLINEKNSSENTQARQKKLLAAVREAPNYDENSYDSINHKVYTLSEVVSDNWIEDTRKNLAGFDERFNKMSATLQAHDETFKAQISQIEIAGKELKNIRETAAQLDRQLSFTEWWERVGLESLIPLISSLIFFLVGAWNLASPSNVLSN